MKKRKKKKQEITKIIFVTLLILLATTMIYFTLKTYAVYSIKNIQTLNYTVNISDYVGLNLDSDKLHFGTVIPGGSSKRSMTLTTTQEGYVYVTSKNNWIQISNQGQYVNTTTPANFEFQINIPKNEEPQNIENKIKFYITKKPQRWIMHFQKEPLLKTFEKIPPRPNIILEIANNETNTTN